MVTAAKTLSQVFTHMGIAFSVAYCLTGSLVFGGAAAILEPVINVAVLPLHQKLWFRVRTRALNTVSQGALILLEKISQLGMHMGIAFTLIFWATGSLAFGGLAAILEPLLNVGLLPVHDRAWEKLRTKMRTRVGHRLMTA